MQHDHSGEFIRLHAASPGGTQYFILLIFINAVVLLRPLNTPKGVQLVELLFNK